LRCHTDNFLKGLRRGFFKKLSVLLKPSIGCNKTQKAARAPQLFGFYCDFQNGTAKMG
jgi:hypothetical protein